MLVPYEQELMHDICYYGRGRGRITESELFLKGYSIIIGALEENLRRGIPFSYLNVLQSHYIFESLKRMVELAGIKVVAEPDLTWREKQEENNICLTRRDMETAAKIKKGEIKLERRGLRFEHGVFGKPYCINLRLIVDQYGLDDGIVKSRCQENRFLWGLEGMCESELKVLRAIREADDNKTVPNYCDLPWHATLPHGLGSYIEMQGDCCYEMALSAIKSGKECPLTHSVFPQIREWKFGRMTQGYGLKGLVDAKAYLENEVLGARLVEITEAVLALNSSDISKVFDEKDVERFRSCMTLFGLIEPKNEIFQRVLDKFFDGEQDEQTLELLKIAPRERNRRV